MNELESVESLCGESIIENQSIENQSSCQFAVYFKNVHFVSFFIFIVHHNLPSPSHVAVSRLVLYLFWRQTVWATTDCGEYMYPSNVRSESGIFSHRSTPLRNK